MEPIDIIITGISFSVVTWGILYFINYLRDKIKPTPATAWLDGIIGRKVKFKDPGLKAERDGVITGIIKTKDKPPKHSGCKNGYDLIITNGKVTINVNFFSKDWRIVS